MLVYIYYPLLILLLFWGAKVFRKTEWNDEVLSFAHTKAFLGFCAVVIMFHHISQRTCAPWLDSFRIRHGLDAFVFVGYLCVAAFFFCSGYGMYTASLKNESFFKRYFARRMLPIILPAVFMWLVFFAIEAAKGMKVDPPVWINTYNYIWYIPAILYLYLVFYLCFHRVKKRWLSVLLLIVGVVLYSVVCLFFSPGTWWYNTHHLFAAGVLVAMHRDAVLAFLKKRYVLWVLLALAVTAVGFTAANYYGAVIAAFGIKYRDAGHFWTELIGQGASALSFAFLVLLIGMKVRIGNRVLSFLGRFTLELYLVHPLFVQLFGFAFVQDAVKPLYYIREPAWYVLAVIIPAVPLAYLLHAAVRRMTGSGKNRA